MAAFKYNFAVVSRIPNSFAELRRDTVTDLEGLRAEHSQFVEILRELGLDVLELEAEERYQECVAVDDTAVVINGTALMCNPLGLHRQGEVCTNGHSAIVYRACCPNWANSVHESKLVVSELLFINFSIVIKSVAYSLEFNSSKYHYCTDTAER